MAVAGSIAVTVTSVGRTLTKYSVAWLSDAAGDVSENTFAIKAGELVEVVFTPSAGGTAPTTLYDVVITDALGIDLSGGAGANLSATVSSAAVPVISTYFRRTLEGGNVTPTVSNAGNAKAGTITLLVR